MALPSTRILCNSHMHTRPNLIPSFSFPVASRSSHISYAKKLSSRTGKFDSKNKKGSTSTSTTTEDEIGGMGDVSDEVYEGYVLPDLPGDKPDFWEGPQWDAFGFFIQYLWAFGIVFALVSGGLAVATYNEGATDFKETPAYKESIQSRELLEEPEASNSDVFESNPTEEAPSLD